MSANTFPAQMDPGTSDTRFALLTSGAVVSRIQEQLGRPTPFGCYRTHRRP
jgi:hypothetical protein